MGAQGAQQPTWVEMFTQEGKFVRVMWEFGCAHLIYTATWVPKKKVFKYSLNWNRLSTNMKRGHLLIFFNGPVHQRNLDANPSSSFEKKP